MSERFKKVYCGILDTSNDGYYACIDDAKCESQRLVNLLNELSEENEQLRQALRFLMNYQRRISNETTCEMGKGVKRMNDLDLYNSFLESRVRTLEKENEQLKATNEKLRWDLNKTREDLNYFANLKVTAMRGSDVDE